MYTDPTMVTAQTGVPRLPAGTTGSFAARLLVASMLVLFLLQFTLTQVRHYTTLESRLVGSLVPIIAVPIVFTTAIAAYNGYTSSQQQFQDTLQAVTSLKAGQMQRLVQTSVTDLRGELLVAYRRCGAKKPSVL